MRYFILATILASFPFLVGAGSEENELNAAQTPDSFTNSLGMRFVNIEDAGIKVSIWETRVVDFLHFVADTGHDATKDVWSPGKGGWKQRGHSWLYPGFSQTLDSPVCGVNSYDALSFCEWLTMKERKSGLLSEGQLYRLPTTAEWQEYIGGVSYPWGPEWPPYDSAKNPLVNAGGDELNDGNYGNPPVTDLNGYNDGYPRSSPVGRFKPNAVGLFDVGGNVFEWSNDWYHEQEASTSSQPSKKLKYILGGAWNSTTTHQFKSTGIHDAIDRHANIGFRIVLVNGK